MSSGKRIANPDVSAVFKAYPPKMRRKLMALRQLIFDTAAATEGVGEIEETLKWGEPAYVTSESKSGSTIRIDWKESNPDRYAMYFNCQTGLVESFRTAYPIGLTFEGNRSIVIEEDETLPVDALRECIAAALTYHANKKKKRRTRTM